MPKVSVSVPVYPSEDPEKVRAAVLKLFPDCVLELTDGYLQGELPTLDRFHNQIRRQRILDTTRSILRKGINGNAITFKLNKQVAYVGKVSFIETETVLGAIQVCIQDVDVLSFIDNLAPETVEGEEIIL
jgi:predicted RNA binding protein with dsRBD fold (UPF0201 family)